MDYKIYIYSIVGGNRLFVNSEGILSNFQDAAIFTTQVSQDNTIKFITNSNLYLASITKDDIENIATVNNMGEYFSITSSNGSFMLNNQKGLVSFFTYNCDIIDNISFVNISNVGNVQNSFVSFNINDIFQNIVTEYNNGRYITDFPGLVNITVPVDADITLNSTIKVGGNGSIIGLLLLIFIIFMIGVVILILIIIFFVNNKKNDKLY